MYRKKSKFVKKNKVVDIGDNWLNIEKIDFKAWDGERRNN